MEQIDLSGKIICRTKYSKKVFLISFDGLKNMNLLTGRLKLSY